MHRSQRLNPVLKFSGQVCFTHYLQINPRGRPSRSCSVAVKLAMTVFCSASSGSAVFCGDDKKFNRVKVASISAGGCARYGFPVPLLLCAVLHKFVGWTARDGQPADVRCVLLGRSST